MKLLLPLVAAVAAAGVAVAISYAVRAGEKHSYSAGEDKPELWTGTATLLQTPNGQLTLCGGATLTSDPPAGCGGAAVRGLDPMTVPGAKRYPNGTITTPSVRLVGTWDGEAMTVTEPAVRAEPTEPDPDPGIPGPSCPERAGGWPFDKVDMDGWERVGEYIATQPDAGSPRVDDSQRIYTVPFTGDLERHRAGIAKLYDGPVCVELAERSDRELRALLEKAEADLETRGLQMMGGGLAVPYVEISVVAISAEEKAQLEESYDGLLRVTSFLEMV